MLIQKLTTALSCTFLFVGSVFAQVCSPNGGTLAWGDTSFNVDTCTSANQLNAICSGLTPIGNATDTIYQLNVPANAGGALSATPTGYDLYLAVLQSSCTGGSVCSREQDDASVGGAETVLFAGLPAGTYFLLLTSFNAASPNCGPTSVVFNPTVPVTLQQFSVD